MCTSLVNLNLSCDSNELVVLVCAETFSGRVCSLWLQLTYLPLFDSRLAFLCYHTGYRVTFQTIICHTTIRHLERTVTFVVWKSGLPLPFLFYLYLCRCFFATGSGFILVR